MSNTPAIISSAIINYGPPLEASQPPNARTSRMTASQLSKSWLASGLSGNIQGIVASSIRPVLQTGTGGSASFTLLILIRSIAMFVLL